MMASDNLYRHAYEQPDAEFAVASDRKLTYAEARDQANRVAHALIAAGLKPGDRIAAVTRNSIETTLLYLGALTAGVVPAPISHRLKPSQWREICRDAEAKLLVCDQEFADEIQEFRNQIAAVHTLVVVGKASPGWIRFDDWIANRPPDELHLSLAEDQDALQIYTSGTTGKPRGVVLSRHAIAACIQQLQQVALFHPADRFLLVMPLFHAAGIMVMMHAIAGGASLLIHREFDPEQVVCALDARDVTVTMLVPSMLHACLTEAAGISGRSFDRLRLIIYGASPISEVTLQQAIGVFKCDFAQRYGSTETLCLSWLTPKDHVLALHERPELLRSAGRPLPGVETNVVDREGQLLPAGETGELIASGPQLMSRYWHTDDDNSLDIAGVRWLRTGDCGFKDADGYLYLRDRIDDVIISGGENIYPREIEKVLDMHPDVRDCAIIGVPDTKWGESIKAIVVTHGNVSANQLIEFCRERLASFKTPQSIDFVSTLPRNASGKLLRLELRKPYWKNHPRSI